MTDLLELGQAIRKRRTDIGLSRNRLSEMAGVSLARIEGLENGRLPEMGLGTLTRLLNALGLDLRLTELNQRRPTLEDLQRENSQS